MGKSPGKWIKTVIFRKKTSKSYLSKDATIDKKTSITGKASSKDSDDDSMVISSPVPPVTHDSGVRTELEKTVSANLTSDTIEVVRSTMENEDELVKLEQAATMAQAAFRGYLAHKAYWALKGIIRLQAQVRGRLVRRQAVATLSCMRAIVEVQALARGRKVRRSDDGCHVLKKYTPLVDKKQSDLLGTSLRSEKLSTNAFGCKLVASSHTIMPLIHQYDPIKPNSVRNWLDRWPTSHFWDPLPRPKKKIPNTKPKRRQTKLQLEETEPVRPKRSIRRVPASNLEGNLVISSENEKQKPVQEQSHNELEKVKLSLRKISVSEVANTEMTVLPLPEPHDVLQENQKTRRRKSFPAKQEHPESVALPSYMAATESAKAKLRAQAEAEDGGGENGFVRRHSLPSSINKLSLQSPRIQKPLQANVKGWIKSNKSQLSTRDDKMLQTGWKR